MAIDRPFITWAEQALQRYSLGEVNLCFLGHSDNLTFRVEEEGGAIYLLRLHHPVVDYLSGIRQLPEAIESELSWMEALAEEGGFPIQRPVRTKEGRLVASIDVEDVGSIPCTLLSWLSGVHFSPAAPGADLMVERLGNLVARMHGFAVHWCPPPGFFRPTYDADHFSRVFSRLLRGVDLGVFSEEVFRSLRAVGQALLAETQQLPDDSEHWGMVHADLHVGNFLVNNLIATGEEDGHEAPANRFRSDVIVPIDFSFCGFGHYVFDVSVCLAGGLKADLRPAFMRGYRAVRPLPETVLRAVDAYALAGRLSYYAYQIDNPVERTWLQKRIPEVVDCECRQFLRGEPLFVGE
jgi:Ser/Thr protein kinase RdoA (MazF antagonist)